MNKITDLIEACNEDPWSLTADQRAELRDALLQQQSSWLPRIQAAVEPPIPGPDFPAFLLELERFQKLAESLTQADLETGTLDELQRFVDLFRSWTDETPAGTAPQTQQPTLPFGS